MAKPTLKLIPLSTAAYLIFCRRSWLKFILKNASVCTGTAQTFERLLDTRPNSRVVGDFSTLRTAERGRRLDDGG